MDTIDRIIALLKEQNKTQKQLTDYLGIDKSIFSQWKNGKNNSYTKYYNEIADFLGVSISAIVGDSISGMIDSHFDQIYEAIQKKEIAPLIFPTRGDAIQKFLEMSDEEFKDLEMFADFIQYRRKQQPENPAVRQE